MSDELFTDGIIHEPLKPGVLRSCLGCRKLFALEFVSKRDTDQQGKICKYRCKACGSEFEFAEFHSPDAI